jgi:FMN phosphatase YigB (HAD superfamily)
VNKIRWEESVWFSDVDDTLIDTAGATIEAAEGVGGILGNQIQNYFRDLFLMMMEGHQGKTSPDYEKLLKEVENYQQEIKQQYGYIKKFSREVLIKIGADRAGIKVTPESIYAAADAYWETLSEKVKVFPGVPELISEIKSHGRPLYLLTSSDARLKLKLNGQFEYIPKQSETFKRGRMELLRNKGIEFKAVSIGDPEDKPHPDFFGKGIKVATGDLGIPIDSSKAIFMGDSYAADLQIPKEQLGFGMVWLFQKGKENIEKVDDQEIITGNLFNGVKYLGD